MSSDRPPPRRQHRSRRQREVHEDTVVAYHNYLQTLIKERLNAINLGPGKTPCQIAIVLYAWGLACAVVGILVIALRPRHLYLTGVWSRFVGPLFIIIFLLSFGAATYFLVDATRKSNKYRRNLRFQALGQFGVKVVHTTRLPHEKIMREEYKTGSTPHVSAKPPRQHRAYRYGQSNRGYLPDNGRDYGREYGREQQGPRYGQQYSHGPPPGHPGPPGPPDVVPGRPRQFKSRVVIQQQQQPPHGGRGPPHGPPPAQRGYAPEDDSSV